MRNNIRVSTALFIIDLHPRAPNEYAKHLNLEIDRKPMRRTLTIALFIIYSFIPVSANEKDEAEAEKACIMPVTPAIPSGRRSKEEEMEAVRDKVKKYLEDNKTFRGCLQGKIDAASKAKSDEDIKTINAAKELIYEAHEMDVLLADLLNREIRIFKSLHK